MSEHTPERIFVDGKDDEFWAHGFAYNEGLVMTEVEYILASKYDETKRQRDEMLEALKLTVEQGGAFFKLDITAQSAIRAAIAKAEGTEPPEGESA